MELQDIRRMLDERIAKDTLTLSIVLNKDYSEDIKTLEERLNMANLKAVSKRLDPAFIGDEDNTKEVEGIQEQLDELINKSECLNLRFRRCGDDLFKKASGIKVDGQDGRPQFDAIVDDIFIDATVNEHTVAAKWSDVLEWLSGVEVTRVVAEVISWQSEASTIRPTRGRSGL